MDKPYKIAFISTMMPTPTNVDGPSSLPFHLIEKRPQNIAIDIYTFNTNKIDSQRIQKLSKVLRCSVQILKHSKLYNTCLRHRILAYFVSSLRKLPLETLIKISKDIIDDINTKYDYLWIYPHYLLGIGNQTTKPTIVTGPDSSALLNKRKLEDPGAVECMGIKRLERHLKWALNLEKKWSGKRNVLMHFVGEADSNYFIQKNPNGKAFFLRHPSNMQKNALVPQKVFPTNRPLKILIAGKICSTTLSDTNTIINSLSEASEELSDKYQITFLGKGWQKTSVFLKEKGYPTECKTWVEDYFEEIRKYDIQLFPISSGAGTKGKVLDALCEGLICVGSECAFENIHLVDGSSAFRYKKADEVVDILKYIDSHKELLSSISMRGYQLVITEHSAMQLSADFFTMIFSFFKNYNKKS